MLDFEPYKVSELRKKLDVELKMINFVLKIQENQILMRIYRTVSSLIQLIPYYIMEEYYIDHANLNVPLEKEDSEIGLLTLDDMALLGNHEESNITPEELIRWLERWTFMFGIQVQR